MLRSGQRVYKETKGCALIATRLKVTGWRNSYSLVLSSLAAAWSTWAERGL
jgi:hypothetical protein